MEDLLIEAPAKINLTLRVLGRRADGYHELESVMHLIDLVDVITLQPGECGIELHSNNPLLPGGEDNLAGQAARLFLEKYVVGAGVKIFIEKNIPIGAGLAGGSTDAAAVLLGLCHWHAGRVPEGELLELAALLGSDVPFCLGAMALEEKQGGRLGVRPVTALARGRGELLSRLPQRRLPWLLVVKPDYQVSTAETYRRYDLHSSGDRRDSGEFIRAWRENDLPGMAAVMANSLEVVNLPHYPEITILKAQLKEWGAIQAMMSGSGPSVFGIFTDPVRARQALTRLRKTYREAYLVSSYE